MTTPAPQKHPRTDFADSLTFHIGNAADHGYRMPAEWEPMDRIWLCPPHNEETWPGCLKEAQAQFSHFMDVLRPHVKISTTSDLNAPATDSWIRDYGPIFVKNDKGKLAIHDFQFNGWGGKYEDRSDDDKVPQFVAQHLKLPLWIHDLVLEGGSIEVNGKGTVMTTEQCLLNKNRNPHLTRREIVKQMHEALGTRHVIWLPGGIVGDDTDGHIDDIARFVSEDTIVAVHAEKDHPDYAMLQKNWDALANAVDQDENPLKILALPMPQPILYNFPADRFGPGGVNPVPASYANFLIANDVVAVPIFGQDTDDQALAILQKAMPKHQVTGVRAEHLVVGLGAFHCLSQQQPKA